MEKKKSKGKELRNLADHQRNCTNETGINSLNMEGRLLILVRDKFG